MLIHRVISESVAHKNSEAARLRDNATQPPKDLISLFFTSKVKPAENQNQNQNLKGKALDSEMQLIRDTVVNFIFNGKDTTSNSMAFFVVMMNRYPALLAKLIYLEAAICENLRLNPIVPVASRQAKEDLVVCDGTLVAKGSHTVLALYATGRSKSVWGEDALEFKPERWIDPVTGKLLVVSPFKFISFFAGPRQYMGVKFAMVEMKCALAVLLSKFDFTTVEDPWEVTYEPAMDLTAKGPLMVKVSSLNDGGATRGPAPSA